MALLIASILYERKNRMRLIRRKLRDNQNSFEIPEERFREIYRMPPHFVLELVDLIRPHMPVRRRNAVPLHTRLLATLEFYGSGSYQRRVGLDNFHNMSQTLISNSIKEISKCLLEHLGEKFVRFPRATEMNPIKEKFMEKFNFPNVIGLIDGTHVAIAGLKEEEEWAYVNRKGYHSINVQIICDADMRILYLNPRYPGSTHDSYIWGGCTIFSYLETLHDNSSYLLGDSGYPLQPWLLTPIRNPITPSEIRFNKNHKETRSLVERCIGVLKSRFRCLLGERKLRYSPLAAAHIISACAILHNFLISKNYNIEDIHADTIIEPIIVPLRTTTSYLEEGRTIRDRVILSFE